MKPAIIATVVLLALTLRLDAQTRTIVFVCEHGAAKSVVAAAHFNRLATERGLPFRAVSRGTAPDPTVPGPIANGLSNEKMSVPAGFKPAAVAVNDVAGASKVVTFDVSLPMAADASKLTRWDKMPAFSDGYGPASAAIAMQVEALVNELVAASKKKH
jgi:arsenate reductase (thioredoxin)